MREKAPRRTFHVEWSVRDGDGITAFGPDVTADGATSTPGDGAHPAFKAEKRAADDAFSTGRA